MTKQEERLAVLMGMAATIVSGWTNTAAGFAAAANEIEDPHKKDVVPKMASAVWKVVAEIERQADIMGMVPKTWCLKDGEVAR